MKSNEREAGYYTGWGVAYSLVGGFFIYAVWKGFGATFCGPPAPPWLPWQTESNCFRDWISALSGYFALSAAVLTVREMMEQRRLANEIQRENVELTIMGRIAGVRNFEAALDIINVEKSSGCLPFFLAGGVHSTPASSPEFKGARENLNRLVSALQDERIRTVEREIGLSMPSSIPLDALDLLCRTIDKTAYTYSPIKVLPDEEVVKIQTAAQAVDSCLLHFALSGRVQSKEFLTRWGRRISN